MAAVKSVELIVGMEVHVELATRSKMFTRAPNGAHREFDGAPPNTLIDAVVLGLPGALPVLNRAAVEMSIKVGLALGSTIARFTKWDRKSYFYPDMPKNYQVSQYDLPLCEGGSFELEGDGGKKIGIIRAHLEEDAGKLLHEWPGGKAIEYSIVDLNRAGTPLLEIVTAPDFRSADEAVEFARELRSVCRFLGVTEGVMQKGHMRFEPNINCKLTLDDGRVVQTPIVEVKNLNSFKSVRGAIEFELREQPRRWERDGREMGTGMKSTRGWDDAKEETFLQREKEDAHDYRYFPDPDLLPVTVGESWVERLKGEMPEMPRARKKRYMGEFGLGEKEASALVEERETSELLDAAVAGVETGTRGAAGRFAANLILQSGFKRANERAQETGEEVGVHELGITGAQIGGIAVLRSEDAISANAADELFGELCAKADGEDAKVAAERMGLLRVRDDAALERWVDEAISNPANAQAVADLRAGKQQAIGRLVGDVMKRSGGKADAKAAREMMIAKTAE
ncbi:MAG TPA: Asp-tRNA(Asn)/Glu-tRNA(Gln) amidotransferase subunit GatB [Phycisphaerales bacterium]|nr:Asp-tRNA(Asn)/Glu-tRNA(Gln) amidotransferase subunit GatB [Phycisphaerales bacterium]